MCHLTKGPISICYLKITGVLSNMTNCRAATSYSRAFRMSSRSALICAAVRPFLKARMTWRLAAKYRTWDVDFKVTMKR